VGLSHERIAEHLDADRVRHAGAAPSGSFILEW
jgi:hypothetical protein